VAAELEAVAQDAAAEVAAAAITEGMDTSIRSQAEVVAAGMTADGGLDTYTQGEEELAGEIKLEAGAATEAFGSSAAAADSAAEDSKGTTIYIIVFVLPFFFFSSILPLTVML
jgi:hypothetical protein